MVIAILRARLLVNCLAVLLLCLSAVSLSFAADAQDAKVQTLKQTAKQLLDIGYEQYHRGMTDNARETLVKAAAYREYLSVADVGRLDSLLEKLSSLPSSGDVQISDQNEQASVVVMQTEQPQVQPEITAPAVQETTPGISVQSSPQQVSYEIPSEEKIKENYIEVVRQRQRIQQSYTKAVVNEAIAKAKEYSAQEEFAKAKDEISRAQGVIERNKFLLGDADYSQYKASLQQLLDEVNTRQAEISRIKAETAQTEARATQEKLRSQQTADRQKRIQDLLASSAEFQEQQRYEEALAQMETLLAIDPLNKTALRNKRMLEDIINLRRQLDLKKEMGKADEDLLYESQKAMIPHAAIYSLPRNWQDIAARKAKIISGLSTVDKAVYDQLDKVVDLSSLTPDTPFSEAIETIRTSIEPPLKIFVVWKDLEENAYIERDTVIGMQGLSGVSLRKGLEDLLRSVSGGVAPINYVVKDGVVTVATSTSLPPTLVTHVYDITELVGAPADYRIELGTAQGGGSTTTSIEETADVVEERAAGIVQMIQETVEPLSWVANGGEGSVSLHGNRGIGNYRLVISQTPQIHEQIQKLLMEDLRESLGQQVSIETRFLFVTENFLEDIGMGIKRITLGATGDVTSMVFDVGAYDNAAAHITSVPGSINVSTPAINLNGGVQIGSLLDDLAVSFFLKATQAHKDAKMLTAPRVTVLSGEAAYIRISQNTAYVSNYSFEDITASGDTQPFRVIATPTIDNTTATSGVVLNVTPTITADKKYVILQINTSYTDAALVDFTIPQAVAGGTEYFPIQLPTTKASEVQTRVSVPDGGTLLIGGQKLGAENIAEAGVPGVSKVPLIGRLFSHRSHVKDQNILLVLVKPTIILQEEKEREFFAPLE